MGDTLRTQEISSPKDYYSHPGPAKAIYRFLGYEGDDIPSLVHSDSTNLGNIAMGVLSEYLSVINLEIKAQKKGRAPARSIKPWDLPQVIGSNPLTEIFSSLWQADALGQEQIEAQERLPTRTLMVIDVEHYHNTDPGKALRDQKGVFDLMDPSYRMISHELRSYGINHMVVMTGRGYHFVTQIPHTSDVMDALVEIGQHIDPSIISAQSTIPIGTKRDRAVPLKAQQAHRGAAYLAHYIVTKTIRNIRQESLIPIQVSDMGTEGIAMDLTPNLIRNVHNCVVGIPGSLYLKPLIKAAHSAPENIGNIPLLTRLPKAKNFQEILNLDTSMKIRQSLHQSAEYLDAIDSSIPDGSDGVRKLILDYKRSNIRQLHRILGEVAGDPPEVWDHTYRKYADIAQGDGYLQWAFANANDKMLNPDVLNYVLNTLFDRWGGQNDLTIAAHIRTFLLSMYEDPRFNWGPLFSRHYYPEQHALGWATIILGQRIDEE